MYLKISVLKRLFEMSVILFDTTLGTFSYGISNGGALLPLPFIIVTYYYILVPMKFRAMRFQCIKTKGRYKETSFNRFRLMLTRIIKSALNFFYRQTDLWYVLYILVKNIKLIPCMQATRNCRQTE
jgi:hypothetical protein